MINYSNDFALNYLKIKQPALIKVFNLLTTGKRRSTCHLTRVKLTFSLAQEKKVI